MILLVSIILGIMVFAGILGGYIYSDLAIYAENNWSAILWRRIALQAVGICAFSGIFMVLTPWRIRSFLISSVIIAVLNMNPIRDLISGPYQIESLEFTRVYKEEYTNLASDFDFTTRQVFFTKISSALKKNGHHILIPEEDWKNVVKSCNDKPPVSVIGLRNMEKILAWKCLKK
jgi:hypothetical protein